MHSCDSLTFSVGNCADEDETQPIDSLVVHFPRLLPNGKLPSEVTQLQVHASLLSVDIVL